MGMVLEAGALLGRTHADPSGAPAQMNLAKVRAARLSSLGDAQAKKTARPLSTGGLVLLCAQAGRPALDTAHPKADVEKTKPHIETTPATDSYGGLTSSRPAFLQATCTAHA